MNLPQNVRAVTDRHGKVRYRFRKAGLPSRYVHGEPGSDAFKRSYEECFILKPTQGAPRPKPIAFLKRRTPDLAPYKGKSVVYFVGARGAVKIGTTVNLRDRFKTLQIGSPQRLRLLACVEGDAALEATYHKQFADQRINGEWFSQRGSVREEIERLNQ